MDEIKRCLASVGVQLYDKDGNIRGFLEVLDELAKIWDDLLKEQKDYICEIISDEQILEEINKY